MIAQMKQYMAAAVLQCCGCSVGNTAPTTL